LLAESSYSGDDIVKVLQACQGMPVAALAAVRPLIENGYSGDDIVKALKACQPPERVPQRDYEPAPWPATTEIKN